MQVQEAVTQVHLRPIIDADLNFLRSLYASTRVQEMSIVPWTEEQKQAFLTQQFEAQHQFYQQQFPQAKFDLILANELPIGRLYIDSRDDEIRVIDIALAPEYRGNGIGETLMSEVLNQARSQSKPVRIHVEQHNPAIRLYQRLGFKPINTDGIYHLMEWNDDQNSGPQ